MISDEEEEILLQFADILAQTTTEVYDERSTSENLEVKASTENQSGQQIVVMKSTVATTLTTTKITTQTTTKKPENYSENQNITQSDMPVDYLYDSKNESQSEKQADYFYEKLNSTFDYIDESPGEKSESDNNIANNKSEVQVDFVLEDDSEMPIEEYIKFLNDLNDTNFDEQYRSFWETYFTNGNFSIDNSDEKNAEKNNKIDIINSIFFQHINISELNPEWFEKEMRLHKSFDDIELSDQFELDFVFFPTDLRVDTSRKEKKENGMKLTRMQSEPVFNKINISDDFIDWFKAELQDSINDLEIKAVNPQFTRETEEDMFENEFNSFWDVFNVTEKNHPMKNSFILNALINKPQFEKINISGEALKWFKTESYTKTHEKYLANEDYDDNAEIVAQFNDILSNTEESLTGNMFNNILKGYFLF
jgi:hypothetical protein